tara:strand:- start:734 stop:1948 length:1215 start_codon:yes stop_codon:yes gene_type:complete
MDNEEQHIIISQGFQQLISAFLGLRFLEKKNLSCNLINPIVIFVIPEDTQKKILNKYLIDIIKKVGIKKILICKKPSNILELSKKIKLNDIKKIYIWVPFIEHRTYLRKFASKFSFKNAKKNFIIYGDGWGIVGTDIYFKPFNIIAMIKHLIKYIDSKFSMPIHESAISKAVLNIPFVDLHKSLFNISIVGGGKKFKVYENAIVPDQNFLKNHIISIRDNIDTYIQSNATIRYQEKNLSKALYLGTNMFRTRIIDQQSELNMIVKHLSLLTQNYDTVYFKPHPNATDKFNKAIYKIIESKLSCKIRFVNHKQNLIPIELFKDIKSFDVFGIISISLFSLNYLFDIKTKSLIKEIDKNFMDSIGWNKTLIREWDKKFEYLKKVFNENPNIEKSILIKEKFLHDLK